MKRLHGRGVGDGQFVVLRGTVVQAKITRSAPSEYRSLGRMIGCIYLADLPILYSGRRRSMGSAAR